MFGYFGKGYLAPAPGAPPEAAAAKAAAEAEIGVEEELPPSAVISRRVAKTPATGRSGVIGSRLQELRAEIAARRREKQAKIQALHARQAKQAAYGRGETSRGRRSESEIAIGVSSGYYSGYNQRFGDLTEEVSQAAIDVQKATDLVKALTEDVKTGSATRSELKRAMKSLTIKAKRATKLAEKSGELAGFGEEKSPWPPLAVLAGLGVLFYLFLPRG